MFGHRSFLLYPLLLIVVIDSVFLRSFEPREVCNNIYVLSHNAFNLNAIIFCYCLHTIPYSLNCQSSKKTSPFWGFYSIQGNQTDRIPLDENMQSMNRKKVLYILMPVMAQLYISTTCMQLETLFCETIYIYLFSQLMKTMKFGWIVIALENAVAYRRLSKMLKKWRTMLFWYDSSTLMSYGPHMWIIVTI